MTLLAFGVNCAGLSACGFSVFAAGAARAVSPSSEAKAMPPSPEAALSRKCRRVWKRAIWWRRFIVVLKVGRLRLAGRKSPLRQHPVQVQQHVGDHGPRGRLRLAHALWQRAEWLGGHRLRVLRVLLEAGLLRAVQF